MKELNRQTLTEGLSSSKLKEGDIFMEGEDGNMDNKSSHEQEKPSAKTPQENSGKADFSSRNQENFSWEKVGPVTLQSWEGQFKKPFAQWTFEEKQIAQAGLKEGEAPVLAGGTQQPGETRQPPAAPVGPQGETPSDQGRGIDSTSINNSSILNEIDVANELMSAGRPPIDALGKALENIARLSGVDEAEKRLAIERIKATIRQYEQTNPILIAEERRNNLQGINSEAIESMSLKSYVSRINSFINAVKAGKLDRGEQLRLINEINGSNPLQDYTDNQIAIFEVERELLKGAIAEAAGTILDMRDQEKANRLIEQLVEVINADQVDKYGEIEKIINSIDIDSQVYAAVIGNVVEVVTEKDDMLEFLLEYGVERILSIADKNPKEDYPQFNLYQQQNLDSVIQAARRYDENRNIDKMFRYLLDLRTKRYVMHELFRSMKDRKTYVGLVTQRLRKDGLAFVEKEIVGVSDIQIIYEQVLGSALSLKKGWLTDQDFAAADEEAKGILQESPPGMLQKEFVRNRNKIPDSRRLREWEINRAWLMGRSLSAASQRRLTYGVMGDLPKGDIDTLLKSVESEFMARILAPLKLIPKRFFSHPLPQRYIRRWLDNIKRDKDNGDKETKYGYINETGEAKGLYGKSQDALAVLDTGVADPKSRSWLARIILLKQPDYKTGKIGEDRLTIGDYLDRAKNLITEKIEKEIKAQNPKIEEDKLDRLVEKGFKQESNKKFFNENIRDTIKNQRLFLGALLKLTDIDETNKRIIWMNVAELIPSRIAAFFPEQTLERVKRVYGIHSGDSEANKEADRKEALSRWNKVKIKLFNIERARVKNDAAALKNDGDGRTKDLDEFFDIQTDSRERLISKGLDNNERQLVRAIQDFGRLRAKDLARIKFPFTPFLDDVPKTDWDQGADEDYDRALISDHSAFEEGYGAIVNLVNNPGTKPDDVIKAFFQAFEKIQSPMGITESQRYLEPHITTYLSMARLNPIAKWFGPFMKTARVPRSEIEQYNLQANIAQDVVDQSNILTGLAQHEVISDDPNEVDKKGKTQLVRMKEENEADSKAKLYVYVRLIILLLGPIAGMEFIKLILPQETIKSLGF